MTTKLKEMALLQIAIAIPLLISVSLNKLLLEPTNIFSNWNWQLLLFPAFYSILAVISLKSLRKDQWFICGMLALVLILSIRPSDGFDQAGFEVIEYASNLIFPSCEIVLQNVIQMGSEHIAPRWLITAAASLSLLTLFLYFKVLNFITTIVQKRVMTLPFLS